MKIARKYPIGIQDFKGLIEDGWSYVDKTDWVYRLAHSHKTAFLSRPRRFGKSLLCSTLRYYFEGEKELFNGLKISTLETDWVKYPVLHMQLNGGGLYNSIDALNETLASNLTYWESKYGKGEGETLPGLRLAGIIRRAHEQTGQKVVFIVDEYDKPLLETMDDKSLHDSYRSVLKAFYGTLKAMDSDLRFIFFTGVTKFSKVSIFSDLNNLEDLTMKNDYATICGITQEEVMATFNEEISLMAEKHSLSKEQMLAELKQMYDGYHFAENLADVYNPFSLLNAMSEKKLGYYWFATGTPTYLTKLLRDANYNLRELTGAEATASRLGDISQPELDPVPILFQSGYLTIKSYDAEFGTYSLDFPNREVRQGFFDALLPQFGASIDENGNGFSLPKFVKAVREGRIDDFMERLKALLANIPYTQASEEKRQKLIEQQYQNVVYIIFTLMGFYTKIEYRTAIGRIDLSIETPDYVYVMEFKVGQGSAEDALAQIEERHYADVFASTAKTLIKVGVGFDNATRNIDKWIVA